MVARQHEHRVPIRTRRRRAVHRSGVWRVRTSAHHLRCATAVGARWRFRVVRIDRLNRRRRPQALRGRVGRTPATADSAEVYRRVARNASVGLTPRWAPFSVIGTALTGEHGLFTVPISGGTGSAVERQYGHATAHTREARDGSSGRLQAPPSTSKGQEQWKTDLWRTDINPRTLEQVTADRLTTGGGVHTAPAIAPDGKRLAFTTGTQTVRLWSFPFDAGAGRLKGAGQPVTEAGARALTFDLTRDGRKLAYATGS